MFHILKGVLPPCPLDLPLVFSENTLVKNCFNQLKMVKTFDCAYCGGTIHDLSSEAVTLASEDDSIFGMDTNSQILQNLRI